MQSRPTSQGDKCLSCGTWRPCTVLPMCVPASPRLGLLLRGSLFSALSPQLWTPCASLIDRSNEPFSVGRPWSWLRHGCELRLTGLSLWVTDCRYCSRHSGSFSRWWVRFLLEWLLQCHTSVEMGFLQWESLLSSIMPTIYLETLKAIVPFPPQIESWSSWAGINLWLPPVRWPEGVQGMSNGCVCPVPHRTFWKVSCRISIHCRIWKPSRFQIYIWLSSIRILLRSSPWLSRVVRLPPTWWNNQFKQQGISAAFIRRGEVPWCPDPIGRTTRVLSLVLVSLVVNGWGFRIFGTYRKRVCRRLHLSTLLASNIPLRQVYVLGSVPLSDCCRSPLGPPSSHIQLLVCRGSIGMGVKNPFCIVSLYLDESCRPNFELFGFD